MKTCVFAFIVAATSTVFAQDVLRWPITHTAFSGSLDMNGGGYAVFSSTATAGLDVESANAVGEATAAYDGAHKTNDGTGPNPRGHDRYLSGRSCFRFDSGAAAGFYFGVSCFETSS